MDSGPGTVTQNTRAELPSEVKPYVQPYLNQGVALANRPYEAYPGATIAGMSPEQEGAMQMTTGRALAGSPTLNAANQNATDTLSGNYLKSNPYIEQMVGRAQDDVMGRLGKGFYGASTGNTGLTETTARALADAGNSVRYGNYEAERNRQMGLIPQAPGLASADYQDPTALAGVGATRQGYAQNLLNAGQQGWQAHQQYPLSQYDILGNALRTTMGGGQSTTGPNPYQGNPLANMLGMGILGTGLYSSLAGLGAAGGAGAGLGTVGAAGGLALSDRRLKRDLRRVGSTDEGLPIYVFRYLNGKRFHMGVMAQDVEKVNPSAVTEFEGFKMVNYGEIS